MHRRDLLRWHAQLLDQIVPRGVAICRDVVRNLHRPRNLVCIICHAVPRQELRVKDEIQIVHGDDFAPTTPLWRNKVWAVQHIQVAR